MFAENKTESDGGGSDGGVDAGEDDDDKNDLDKYDLTHYTKDRLQSFCPRVRSEHVSTFATGYVERRISIWAENIARPTFSAHLLLNCSN